MMMLSVYDSCFVQPLSKRPNFTFTGVGDYGDDELLILKKYFRSGIGYKASQAPLIKKLIYEDFIACNTIGAEIIGEKFSCTIFMYQISKKLP